MFPLRTTDVTVEEEERLINAMSVHDTQHQPFITHNINHQSEEPPLMPWTGFLLLLSNIHIASKSILPYYSLLYTCLSCSV